MSESNTEKSWPFSSSTTMKDETILFSQDINPGFANLLFKPEKVISLKMADGSSSFLEGKDFLVDRENGRLALTQNTSIKSHVLFGDVINHGQWKDSKGRNILWGEADLMHRLQLKVTYTHSGKAWEGKPFIPRSHTEKLPKTVSALNQGKALNLVITGDSITVGYNSSGFVNAPPLQPSWSELVLDGLKKRSGSKITYNKIAVAGKTATWGLKQSESIVSHKPDLLIIAFGMNDAGRRGDHYERSLNYKEAIAQLISNVRAEKETEIILVSNMLPNSEFKPHEGHFQNLARLRELHQELENVALADVMSITEEILKRKTYADISGNHLNHPNDWIHRLYAEVVLGIL